MLFWVVQTIIFSILFIFLAHHLLHYFKTTLTVPKIKDLVNGPVKKYEDIYNVIHSNEKEEVLEEKPDLEKMKSELKNYLKTKSSSQTEGSTTISTLGSNEYTNYAEY
jgi:hypothetical protein